MFLVRLIDVFVGILKFVFQRDSRVQGASAAVLGSAGVITLLALVLIAVGIPQINYQTSTSDYTAELENAAGLTTADPILVAGVPAGRIEAIKLAGDRVKVEFRLDRDQPLGDQTRAEVRLRTVLGKRYLDIVPAGTGEVGENRTIPLSRTTTPYSLDDISAAATDTAAETDSSTLRQMITTMNQLVPESTDLDATLTGAVGAASVISSTGDQMRQLLQLSQRLAEVTAAQSDSLGNAMSSTQTLVQTLSVRRAVLDQLADNLRDILAQMAATFPQIPMEQLAQNALQVTDTLRANAGQIDRILTQLPPAMRSVTDASGNGNWADVVSPSAVIPDGLLCLIGVVQECR